MTRHPSKPRYIAWCLTLYSVALLGQGTPPHDPAGKLGGSNTLRGSILDADTRLPVGGSLKVTVWSEATGSRSVQGDREYRVTGLSPGQYTLEVAEEGYRFSIGRRMVTVTPRHATANVYVRRWGTVSGIVRGPDRQPLIDVRVLLVIGEYWFGRMQHFAPQTVATDDRGRFYFKHVAPATPFSLLVLPHWEAGTGKRDANLPPEKRQSVLAGLWYPEPPLAGASGAVPLTSGEHRSIDLELSRTPSLCIAGVAGIGGRPGPVPLDVNVTETSGYSPGGADRGRIESLISQSDGTFRLCGLWPGNYTIRALPAGAFGLTELTLALRDSEGVAVNAFPPGQVAGDIEFEGEFPGKSRDGPQVEASVLLTPANRQPIPSEPPFPSIPVKGPGSFTLPVQAATKYSISLIDAPPDLYLKSASCGGEILAAHLFDTNIKCPLHIVISADERIVQATVVLSGSGEPVSDAAFCLTPATATSREDIATGAACSEVESGAANARVRPGKYYALIRPDPQAVDWVEDLFAHRSEGVLVDTGANPTIRVTIEENK